MPEQPSVLGVAAASPDQQPAAEQLAATLALPCYPLDQIESGLLLLQQAERLVLQQIGPGAPGAVWVDFVEGKAAHRRKFGGGRGQPLARAIGLKKGWTPRVLDMTAGLGRDAFVLATLGCRVEMIERSPVVHALLADGLRRAQTDGDVAEIVTRMSLRCLDGREYNVPTAPDQRPDVVYLDPMYPHREKSAKVKKEMRLFQLLLGEDQDSATLLERALHVATHRVVVKRPVKAPPLGGRPPSVTVGSPNTRYDIYLTGPRHATA
ncbi:class I SAM-dependent methyltransferase [Sedimenticola sp.]|uniref:class I SAM-dependent methyltransferase n=1 Tax=Sedimenticola sp. TaxID=1940285 RepID=UPI003D0F1396